MLSRATTLLRPTARALSSSAGAPDAKRVAVTGSAGAIGYALLMRIASGQVFGPSTPVHLSLLETPAGMAPLTGVAMELADGAFPLLASVTMSSDPHAGFDGADAAFLVGATPRGPGMERKDLMEANAAIFAEQGKAINERAAPDVQVLVVGNPANTNALVAAANAPRVDARNFYAMTRLDQNRAMGMLASKAGVSVREVDNVVIWGNHSATQVPDVYQATIGGEKALDVLGAGGEKWYKEEFIPRVQKRGAEIIGARGKSSAASAASAAVDCMRDVFAGSDKLGSAGVVSDGSFGIDEGIWYSVPVICEGGGKWGRPQELKEPNEFIAGMMDATRLELLEERDAVRHLLPGAGGATGVTPLAAKKNVGRPKKVGK